MSAPSYERLATLVDSSADSEVFDDLRETSDELVDDYPFDEREFRRSVESFLACGFSVEETGECVEPVFRYSERWDERPETVVEYVVPLLLAFDAERSRTEVANLLASVDRAVHRDILTPRDVFSTLERFVGWFV